MKNNFYIFVPADCDLGPLDPKICYLVLMYLLN